MIGLGLAQTYLPAGRQVLAAENYIASACLNYYVFNNNFYHRTLRRQFFKCFNLPLAWRTVG